MEEQIKAWSLKQIAEAKARRNWSALPQDFELNAVAQVYRSIAKNFDKRAIKARIAASKAQTFDELETAVLSA